MEMETPADRETERLLVQEALDLAKSPEARNKLGQFATPARLAREVVFEAVSHLSFEHGDAPIRFLDPALGTGAFWSVLNAAFSGNPVSGVGVEVDPAFADASRRLWTATGLRTQHADFLEAAAPGSDRERFDLLICNPPYVRHHHIAAERKPGLRAASVRAAGIDLSGLAGLYCHFLAHAHPWMKLGGIAAWLVPSEFMDVNYGAPLKRYLLERVTLLRIHRFDPEETQFSDALVSSAVVIFRNEPPPPDHRAEFSSGPKLRAPLKRKSLGIDDLRSTERWGRIVADTGKGLRRSNGAGNLTLGDVFRIRRGLVTGGNDFFVVSEGRAEELELPRECLTPILPSPRYLDEVQVFARADGTPDLSERKFLIDCALTEDEVKEAYPALWSYLRSAPQSLRDRYICRHRSPWYRQEVRPAAPLLCTYLGRRNGSRRPFRFVLNHSSATAANVYHLLYPLPTLLSAMESEPDLLRHIWEHLNAVDVEDVLRESRVYGGGLYKLEPKELSRVSLDGLSPELRRKVVKGGVPEFPVTELGRTHQLLETVQLDSQRPTADGVADLSDVDVSL